jgi:hypothetical protein
MGDPFGHPLLSSLSSSTEPVIVRNVVMLLTREDRIHLALNSIEDDTIIGKDLLRLLGMDDNIDKFESYLLDLIDETGSLPVGEFDDFEICGDCNRLIVWDRLYSHNDGVVGGYRHVRDGKFKCEGA